ncbi:neuropeptide CCHamide-2 receptor-like [Homalodisca vitripennis]|uniref:neuropeptide CCHamide-2 receptor-like n=1 Tax=Homalodisca vitripennis TaxID=197043 RepID=UPI001EEBA535|nr:neuropeptide CCHamide-2 receptor-like [Homalodisca vitripennis]
MCVPEFHKDIPPAAFYAIFLPLFVVGTAGNGLYMFVIARHQNMLTTTNKLIFSLCLADTIIIISSAVAPVLDNAANVPFSVCGLIQFLRETAVGALVYTLVVLCGERYYSFAYPEDAQSITPRVANFMAIAVWILAGFLALGKFLSLDSTCTRKGWMISSKELVSDYSIVGFVVIYFLPIFFTTMFYVLMGREFYLTNLPLESVEALRLMEAKKRLTRVVFALTSSFILFFAPYYTIRLLVYFDCQKLENWTHFTAIILYLTNVYPCTNPVVLYVTSALCRKVVNQYLCNREQQSVVESEKTDSPKELELPDEPRTRVTSL